MTWKADFIKLAVVKSTPIWLKFGISKRFTKIHISSKFQPFSSKIDRVAKKIALYEVASIKMLRPRNSAKLEKSSQLVFYDRNWRMRSIALKNEFVQNDLVPPQIKKFFWEHFLKNILLIEILFLRLDIIFDSINIFQLTVI